MKSKFKLSIITAIMSLHCWCQTGWETSLEQIWVGNGWENYTLTSNTYNNDMHLIHSLYESWQITEASWVDTYQVNYINNPDGTVFQSTMQFWSGMTNTWNDYSRTTNTFDSGHLIQALAEMWEGQWNPSMLTTNTFDSNGYLVNSLNQYMPFPGGEWSNSIQTNYTNNPNSTVAQAVTQTWGISNAWVNQSRETHTYNDLMAISTTVTESWVGNQWMNDSFVTYNYDQTGALLTVLVQYWDSDNAIWENASRSTYTNNASAMPLEILFQVWTPELEWRNEMRYIFSYDGLGLRDNDQPKVLLFPNPAVNLVTLISTEGTVFPYTIVDLNGKLVLSGNDSSSIDVASLASGVYFIKTASSQKAIKLIKD